MENVLLKSFIFIIRKLKIFDKALEYKFKYLALQRSTSSPDNKQLANTLKDIAILYQLNNQPTSALVYYQQSLEIFQTIFGSEHHEIKDIQQEILSINQDHLSSDNEEQYSLKTVIPDNDTRNQPTIRYSNSLIGSAACILF